MESMGFILYLPGLPKHAVLMFLWIWFLLRNFTEFKLNAIVKTIQDNWDIGSFISQKRQSPLYEIGDRRKNPHQQIADNFYHIS